jgi:hypothetical protein
VQGSAAPPRRRNKARKRMIEKVKEPYRQPNILAEYIAFQLKNRVSFRKATRAPGFALAGGRERGPGLRLLRLACSRVALWLIVVTP